MKLGGFLSLLPSLFCCMGMILLFTSWAKGGESILQEENSAKGEKHASLYITADQLEFDQATETYRAEGSVVIIQGPIRLTSDEAILHKLTGHLLAKGHVHLKDQVSDLWSEQLDLNVNTEAGVVTQGKLFRKDTNTWIRGRLLQRFSETHYRAKEGSFTNCDAEDGQIPAWSFSFKDIDLEQNDSVYARGVWFRVKDYPLLPLPALRYPMPGGRKTGFLFPTVGVDNVFGFVAQQGFFWAISQSQDMTITPRIMSKRGQGGDLEYRYILNRQSRGNWLVSSLHDTVVDRTRALITGAHTQVVNPDLFVRLNVNYATDRTLLLDLSNSGVLRALPSQESVLFANQRLAHGNVYLMGQYLQPLNLGGNTTFQRLPEIGHSFAAAPLLGNRLLVDMNSTLVYFSRQEGFDVGRIDLLPGIAAQGLHLGHVIGLRPQVRLREVAYTHGRQATQNEVVDRGTFWAGFEASTSLSRRFSGVNGQRLRHSIESNVFYEFVPPTKQSDIIQIDQVDNLQKKNLVTYSINTSLKEVRRGTSLTWVNLLLAQSYHLGGVPGLASPFSNIWGRATINFPTPHLEPGSSVSFLIDSFYDPGHSEFSQLNADAYFQMGNQWYATIGHRFKRNGVVPQRGDIWNPISFNEVLSPQPEINFITAGGGMRLSSEFTVGSKVYHDFTSGVTSELDAVALYRNPCRCWSLGLYYVRLAGVGSIKERNQFNFVLTLRGVGATPGFGTQVLKSLLLPLLGQEPGLPWSPR